MNTISIMRRWNSPEISIVLTEDGISIGMSLTDFVTALTDEVAEPLVRDVVQTAGSPVFVMTKTQLEKRLVVAIESRRSREIFEAAAERIVAAVKRETTKAV